MRKLIGLVLVAGVAAAACSGGADIEVTEAWGRPSPAAATNGAFYMVIVNNTDIADHLVGVSTDACGVTELHESVMSDGVMGMQPVGEGGIEVPAGGEVELAVGGLHVMCIDKQVDFAEGATVDLTLEFENAGTLDVEADIREG